MRTRRLSLPLGRVIGIGSAWRNGGDPRGPAPLISLWSLPHACFHVTKGIYHRAEGIRTPPNRNSRMQTRSLSHGVPAELQSLENKIKSPRSLLCSIPSSKLFLNAIFFTSRYPMMASPLPSNVAVSRHPCLRAKISQLRSKSTNARDTKALVHEIALLLGSEALAQLEIEAGGTVSPLCCLSSSIPADQRFRLTFDCCRMRRP